MKKYVLVIFAVLLVFGLGYYFAYTTKFSENAELKKQLSEIETQKVSIDLEKEKLKEQIRLKEVEVEIKEVEISDLQSKITANGRNLANERQKVQKAIENYQQELANISIPTDNYSRCIRLCESRASLGYSCSSDFCLQYR